MNGWLTCVVFSSLGLFFLHCGEERMRCAPDCAGRECGPDGCGGECSPGCNVDQTCNEYTGTCESCTPVCAGNCCGDDGCGGECPDICAATEQTCNPDTCGCEWVCIPDCAGRECGPDGCGGTCRPGCDAKETCDQVSGQCQVDCTCNPNPTNISQSDNFDFKPAIDDGKVVWMGGLFPPVGQTQATYEIYFYDGNSTNNLSNTANLWDSDPDISGDLIVWKLGDAYGDEKYLQLHRNGTTTQLSSRLVVDDALRPVTGGGNAVWLETIDKSSFDVMYYNGATSETTKLHTIASGGNRWGYDVSTKGVVWTDAGFDIMYFDGSNITSITTYGSCCFPRIDDRGNIIWLKNCMTTADKELYLRRPDGTIVQLSSSVSQDPGTGVARCRPQVDDGQVVWTEGDTIYQVVVYNGSTIEQITSSGFKNKDPFISEGYIIWSAESGTGGYPDDLWYFNGTSVTRLTSDGENQNEARISKGKIVYTDYVGSREVFIWDLYCMEQCL